MNAVTGRRTFLKLSGAGLALGFYLAVPKLGQAATPNAFTPNALIRITPDGKILILAKTPEIGQGIKTAFPMIIAEELDADWADVVVEQAAINPKLYGSQSAFGSTAVADTFDILRKAGATARAMLTSAAAQTWKVPESECATGKSAVTHTPSGRVLKYAALTEKAAMLPVPDTAPFKARADYKILGTRIGGVDNKKIVTGEPLFGIDTVRPGMVFAIYEKCPNAGGKPTAFNEAEIKKLPGVLDAFMVEGNGRAIELQPGVAIVATSTYYAFEAKKQLKISWEGGATDDSDTHRAQAREMVKNAPAEMLRSEGDLDAAINTAAKVIDEYYEYPFITHATLEPQNCTAHFTGNAIEIWAPSQGCDRIAAQLAPYLGLAAEQITVHHTRVGGGFGRRLNNDYVFEVAAITKRIGKPVKLTWSREDDFAHDHYAPPATTATAPPSTPRASWWAGRTASPPTPPTARTPPRAPRFSTRRSPTRSSPPTISPPNWWLMCASARPSSRWSPPPAISARRAPTRKASRCKASCTKPPSQRAAIMWSSSWKFWASRAFCTPARRARCTRAAPPPSSSARRKKPAGAASFRRAAPSVLRSILPTEPTSPRWPK